MILKFIQIIFVCSTITVFCSANERKEINEDVTYHPFDRDLYEEVLDPELCQNQLRYITINDTMLLARFLDAGIRTPRGILMGNTLDMGNYHQCLGIHEAVNDMKIQGKYCMIKVPLNQDLELPNIPDFGISNFDLQDLRLDEHIINNIHNRKLRFVDLHFLNTADDKNERMASDSPLGNMEFTLAICLPAPCTTKEVIDGLLFNISSIGFEYEDNFCRLPDDKPWAPVDYVATIIFSIIGFLTILSTAYDVYYTKVLKKDAKSGNTLCFSFSAYTNARKLLSSSAAPNSLDCIDGIRAIAMLWVIYGHAFYTLGSTSNPIDTIQWMISSNGLWVTAGPMAVDTFFLLSGLLLVYSTAGKMNGRKLITNLHFFYLNRLLRMFPVLAAMILFEASHYNHISDGPIWSSPAAAALRCRQYWWSALLHIQNFVNPENVCVGVTWYLSVDVQLHILSPIVLYWVLSGRRLTAWIALLCGLLGTLTASTIYIFIHNFRSGIISLNRDDDVDIYFVYYYINTLTRASPFLVGMVFGYLLHVYKGKKLKVSKILILATWCCIFMLYATIFYCLYIHIQLDWDNQFADNILNSFMRAFWGMGLGWIIFACANGYGGPINWFLTLSVWKLPARLSYAMYLIHITLMVAYYSSAVAPTYFNTSAIIFNFIAFTCVTIMLAFIVTITIDFPFSTLIKLYIIKDTRKPQTTTSKETKEVESKFTSIKNEFTNNEKDGVTTIKC